MDAYEIEHLEKQMRAGMRLPLSFQAWSVYERGARQERARVVGKVIAEFFSVVLARITAAARQVRTTAAACTDARLRHDH